MSDAFVTTLGEKKRQFAWTSPTETVIAVENHLQR
jgi:hypothetical protein